MMRKYFVALLTLLLLIGCASAAPAEKPSVPEQLPDVTVYKSPT